MRILNNLSGNWFFTKENNIDNSKVGCDLSTWETVTVPHTWNNIDGQGGAKEFYRGACWYRRELNLDETFKNKEIYLEFEAVNAIADVYVNGVHVGHHEGGFSTFRFNVTQVVKVGETNIIAVCADNSDIKHVYPTMADFTFYGGIYRDIKVIAVEKAHISLEDHGSCGVYVTSVVKDGHATVDINAILVHPECAAKVVFAIKDGEGNIVAKTENSISGKAVLNVENPRLWNGTIDPYMYTAVVTVIGKDGAKADEVEVPFGIRTFSVDFEKGFVLNGEFYHLHGVSRHQDRENMGWAISEKEHKEDMEIIKEVGANTIRLAHYQHAQYFYDLCDEAGMILWAEIPFISAMTKGRDAHENCRSQMIELVKQNYNHPSICFWGISNEIGIGGENEELLENLKDLNKLVKELDNTRMTTMAQVSFTDMESEHNQITDVVSYNHYFGWYGGEISENGEWFDEFHKLYPNRPLGVSEYGAEGILKYHTETPEVKDYTEEYHGYYHEKMLEIFAERPYLWSTHVWNMFDFGSAIRDEGGVKGRNNKGLVTFDRKTKKDAFYVYKAYWTTEPMVHLCGRRFVDRPTDTTNIKVYSNAKEISLKVNGEVVKTLAGDKVFLFEKVGLNMGENIITAISDCGIEDTIVIQRVTEANPEYTFVDEDDDDSRDGAANWFDDSAARPKPLEFPEGRLSVKDKMGEIFAHPEAGPIMMEMMSAGISGDNVQPNKGMMKMLANMSFEQIVKMAGKKMPKGTLEKVNEALIQYEKINK